MGAPTADWFSSRGDGIAQWPLRTLLCAAVPLRAALDAAPHNHQLSLALMQIYLCLGAPSAARDLYRRLDVKYIQHETVCARGFDVSGGSQLARPPPNAGTKRSPRH